jgi:hypothetical protein
MSQSEIEELELSIEHAKEIVERGKMAEKLSTIPEFKKLVLDGYFVNEAARLALLYSDSNLSNEGREAVARELNGPGAFKRYLSTMVQMGHIAQRELREHMETLDEVREEEGAN